MAKVAARESVLIPIFFICPSIRLLMVETRACLATSMLLAIIYVSFSHSCSRASVARNSFCFSFTFSSARLCSVSSASRLYDCVVKQLVLFDTGCDTLSRCLTLLHCFWLVCHFSVELSPGLFSMASSPQRRQRLVFFDPLRSLCLARLSGLSLPLTCFYFLLKLP